MTLALSERFPYFFLPMPTPIYKALNLNPAFHLRYSWTTWPSGGCFAELPSPEILSEVFPLWEKDGLRLLERYWSREKIQITFSAMPQVSPVLLATRAKGRLQYAFRMGGHPSARFSRKLSVRSVGKNETQEVLDYIESQVSKANFVDRSFQEFMKEFTVGDPKVELGVPTETARGRYWYNLHLVLVVQERARIVDRRRLEIIRDSCFKIARKKGYGIAAASVMPDHLHLGLRGNPEHSPEEIALAFQNNLAYALGQNAVWSYNYYAGTFSEYDMAAIRRNPSPE
ncbi:MAG: transposase [Planctomycetes bacterium]|nr:transposase [Planctomycetota bacterium]